MHRTLRYTLVGLWTVEALAAVILLVLRAGGPHAPAPWPALVLTGLVLAGLGVAYRVAWKRWFQPQEAERAPRAAIYNWRIAWDLPRREAAVRWLPAATRAAIVFALLSPGVSLAAASFLVALMTAVETGLLAATIPLGKDGGESETQQQFTRRLANGDDVIEGRIRAHFAAGQRTAAVHLAFCPPFDRVPDVTVQAGGEAVHLTVEQALPYAARIQAKLPQPAGTPQHIEIRVTAVCEAVEAAARAERIRDPQRFAKAG